MSERYKKLSGLRDKDDHTSDLTNKIANLYAKSQLRC